MSSGRGPALIALAVAWTLLGIAPAFAQESRDRRIGDATDATTASVGISQGGFAAEDAAYVVVGRNDLFADNLGGAALAGMAGPLLLTDPGPTAPLRTEIADEIAVVLGQRNRANCDGSSPDVYILGGTMAVSPAAQQQLADAGYCVRRLAGPSRVETAVVVATEVRALHAGQAGAAVLLVARNDGFADSATGGTVAARFGSPIVVTTSGELHPAVADFVRGTAPDDIVLLGGTAALSPAVEEQLRALAPGRVRRVAGSTRDETARVIAEQLYRPAAGGQLAAVSLANGFQDRGWIYALAGGVASARRNAPMLYADVGRLPGPTQDWLAAEAPAEITAIGPAGAISEATRAAAREIADGG